MSKQITVRTLEIRAHNHSDSERSETRSRRSSNTNSMILSCLNRLVLTAAAVDSDIDLSAVTTFVRIVLAVSQSTLVHAYRRGIARPTRCVKHHIIPRACKYTHRLLSHSAKSFCGIIVAVYTYYGLDWCARQKNSAEIGSAAGEKNKTLFERHVMFSPDGPSQTCRMIRRHARRGCSDG